jgi:hypothetical protein
MEKVTRLVCGLENWVDWCPPARDFIMAREGHGHAHG